MPDTFRIREVAGGVWAAIAADVAGPAVSNAAIIDLGDKTVVVDTFMTALAADELRAAVRRLTGRGAFMVVNSHWHSDHVRGNQLFAAVPIVGTRIMAERIIEDAPKDQADYDRRVASLRVAAVQSADQAVTDAEHREAEGTMALVAALEAGAEEYRTTLPDVLIGDRLDVEGERSLTVLGYGRGHTESDLFVHLPDERIVVAGDLVWTGVHPKTSDGFPAAWAEVVTRIEALGPAAVVPGHGEPGGAAEVAVMAAYLSELDGLVAAAAAGNVDPAGVAVPAGSEEWKGEARFRAWLAALAGRSATMAP